MRKIIIGTLSASAIISSAMADATVPLQWDAVSNPNANYRVKWGSVSGQYTNSQDAATDLTWAISLPVGKWFVAVFAYDETGETLPSNEIEVIVAHVTLQTTLDFNSWHDVTAQDVAFTQSDSRFFRSTINPSK